MSGGAALAKEPRAQAEEVRLESWAMLNALPDAIMAIDRRRRIRYANTSAEQFLGASQAFLQRHPLDHYLPEDSPLFSLIEQVFEDGTAVSEHGVSIETPRIGTHFVSLQVSSIVEQPEFVMISIHQQNVARKIDHQLIHRGASRSVTAMAAMLAHEVKNPLSGIRGAAQLLERDLSTEDRALTQLIRDETDRICALVDRMEIFSDKRPIERTALNIHEVLEHVRTLARHGFAKDIAIREDYDPSLPPVWGNRDQLVQVFLNLVKNAAEAVPAEDGEIVLSTAYRQGVRLALRASESRVQLPLVVSVQDNGPGVPEDLRDHLFDPFITSKASGTGLGLALVAKIVDDHGGVIEFNSEVRRTVFNVMLPVYSPDNSKEQQ
jgi:two-component system nitrogen regulation sensor histidine kinase GlnL